MPYYNFTLTKSGRGLLESDYLSNIREHFSVKSKGADAARRRTGSCFIPTRKYAITPGGQFSIGLFTEIYKYIRKLNLPAKINISDGFFKQCKPTYSFSKEEIIKLSIPLRDYQTEAVYKLLEYGRGAVEIATAGGKTLTMASLIQTIRKHEPNTLILITVPTLQLIEQTYNDFIQYGINSDDISRWSAEHNLNLNAKIIIAGTSILLSKKQDTSWLKYVDVLVVDEDHGIKPGNKINKIINKIKTPHKFGFTGSMPEDKLDEWFIIGTFGPIMYRKLSHELREEGYIANVKIKIIEINYPIPPIFKQQRSIENPTAAYEEECDFINNNEFRNNTISRICNKLDNNVLIMVDRIAHGELLETIIRTNTKKKVYFIQGSVEVDDREKIRSLMEGVNDVICIAISKIFSTGIDIKNLHYIIFASAGKSKIKIVQSIGRGLRLHKDKSRLVVFDIADNLYYGLKHLQSRTAIYDKEKIMYDKTVIDETGKR